MQPRLKAAIWVSAQLRLCAARGLYAVVVRHGDDTAGTILIKVNGFARGCRILAPRTSLDGERVWYPATGPEPVNEADADAYVERQSGRDPDLWVVEIEDRDGVYDPGEPMVES